MSARSLVIGSRGSALALWQAEHVRARLEALGHTARIEVITTTGDRVLDRRLQAVGGKGAFLKEIEEALEARQVDLAVHSLKDVPTELPAGLHLVATLERADPRDAFLSRDRIAFADLPPGSRVGTTSLRRQAQLRALRPDLVISDLRGNVDTRIRKLRDGEYDAILLAMAGLTRLGLLSEVTEPLAAEVLLPAPGQGAIAIECRQDQPDIAAALLPLHHAATHEEITAERSFLARLGGGCNVPLGAFAEGIGAVLSLRAFVASADGSRILRGERAGGADAAALGRGLAEELLSKGADQLLGR